MDPVYQKLYPVRINDLNYGQHVGHQKVYEFCHDARVEWLAGLGHSEMNFGGHPLAMSQSQAQYKAEITHPSQLLVKVFLERLTPWGFVLSYTLEDGNTGQIKALVQTTMVCLNPQTRRPTRAPKGLLKAP